MNQLFALKQLRGMEGVNIYITGHIGIRLLQLDGFGVFLMPGQMKLGSFRGQGSVYHKMRVSLGRHDPIASNLVWSAECIFNNYCLHVDKLKNRLCETGDERGVSILYRKKYRGNGEDITVYFTPEQLKVGFRDMGEAVRFTNELSLKLASVQHPTLTEKELIYKINLGRLLTYLHDEEVGDSTLARICNVGLGAAKNIRCDAKVVTRHRLKFNRLMRKHIGNQFTF